MKRRGVKLGNPSRKGLMAAGKKGAASTKTTSDAFATSVLPMIEGYVAKGLTVRQIAVELNKRRVGTLRGGSWYGSTVVKLRQRARVLTLREEKD